LIPFAPGLSGELHVLKKVVTLLLNCFGSSSLCRMYRWMTQTTKAKHNIAERLWKIRSPGLIYRGER
jgi:hypothetical protein